MESVYRGDKRYENVKENDKIAICFSGGKDSMLLAKLMQELQKHGDVPFELVFLQRACRFTENCAMSENGVGGSKSQEMKQLINTLRLNNPNVEKSVFKSLQCVYLNTMIGYKINGIEHSFLDDYDNL